MDSSLYKGSRVARMIWIVVSPIVFTVGVVGNIITILVLTHKIQKKSSTTVFLTVLAVADLAVMLVSLPRWWLIYMFGLDIRHLSNGACKMHWFIGYIHVNVSTNTLAAVTIERVLSTVIPHKTKILCSARVALAISGGIVLLFILLNLHVPIAFSLFDVEIQEHITTNLSNESYILPNTTLQMAINFTEPLETDLNGSELNELRKELGVENSDMATIQVFKMCWFKDKIYQEFYIGPFQVLNVMVYTVIPETIFFIGGLIIVRKLRASRFRIAAMRIGIKPKNFGSEMHQRQITKSLLLVNAVFVVCTTPMLVFLAGRAAWVDSENGMTEVQEIVWAVINILFYSNHAVNFVLYFLSGERFRKQVRTTFSAICKRKERITEELQQSN